MQYINFEREAFQFVVKIFIRHLDLHFKPKTVKTTGRTVKTILESERYTKRQHQRLLRQLRGN